MKETIKNLSKAFIGESQARNRYTFYSKAAKKEGYEQISELFLVTADNEREHASQLFKMIQELKEKAGGGYDEIAVDSGAPTVFGTTAENLKAAIAGENYEHTTMYPEFADMADKEGLPEFAKRLRAIGQAEVHHEDRYLRLLQKVETGTVLKSDKEAEWVCRKCGYVHTGTEPPEKCPACGHPANYYERKCEEY